MGNTKSINVAKQATDVLNDHYTELMSKSSGSAVAVNQTTGKAAGDITIGKIDQDTKSYVDISAFTKQATSQESKTDLKNSAKSKAVADSQGWSTAESKNYIEQFTTLVTQTDTYVTSSCISDARSTNIINMQTQGDIKGNTIEQSSFAQSLSTCVSDQISENSDVTEIQNLADQSSKSKTVSPIMRIFQILIVFLIIFLIVAIIL